LAGPLKGVIGLSDKEICDLTDYFRIQDGRILYSQFCELIHDSGMNDYFYVKCIFRILDNYRFSAYAAKYQNLISRSKQNIANHPCLSQFPKLIMNINKKKEVVVSVISHLPSKRKMFL